MNAIQYISDLNEPDQSKIRSSIYKKGILSSFNEDGRMIMYTSKNSRFLRFNNNTQQNMWLECNGLVIDTNTMKPLVIPPISFVSNIDTNIVNTHIANDMYEAYRIEDGTIITLYHWGNSWRISTARGYDMTDQKWGTMSYIDILHDILEKQEIPIEKFFNSLNKQRCYTFGFKHESMHPFREGTDVPINKLWFIQSVGLDSPHKIKYELAGIPNQTKYTFPAERTTKVLFRALTTSLSNYMDTKAINYGFILRSKNPTKTGLYSHIILESSLMQKIRTLYYNSNLSNHSNEMKYDREKYTIVNSYLDANLNGIFIYLFPQFTPAFDKLNTITTTLIKSILTHANPNNIKGDDPTSITAKFLYEQINLQCKLDLNDRHINKLISSYLLNPTFSDIFYNLLDYKVN